MNTFLRIFATLRTYTFTVFAIVVFSSANLLHAQEVLTAGIYIYPQTSFLIHREKYVHITMKPTYASCFAFHVRKPLNKSFSIIFGTSHSVQGQKYQLDDDKKYRGSVFLRYAKTPLLLHYNFLIREKYFMYLNIGPQLNMLVQEEGSLPLFYDNRTFDQVHPGSAYREFIVDGALGIGIDILLVKNVYLTFISRAEYSTRADKKEAYNYYQYKNGKEVNTEIFETIRNTRNLTLAIASGINLRINKNPEKANTPPN